MFFHSKSPTHGGLIRQFHDGSENFPGSRSRGIKVEVAKAISLLDQPGVSSV